LTIFPTTQVAAIKAANESLFVEELLEIEKRRREPKIFYHKAELGIAHESGVSPTYYHIFR
jgi:hypothetical protein